MRRRTLAALGLGTTAGATTCALLTTGVVGASLAVLVAPPLVAPAAAELPLFDDCAELRQWYVDAALPYVGPWGLGGGPVVMADAMAVDGVRATAAEAAPAPGEAVGSGDTGTNVQEAGVDEPDVAKTDGRVVAHVRGHQVVLTDVTGEPRELSRVEVPRRLGQPELLLAGDTLLVLGQTQQFWGWRDGVDVMPVPGGAEPRTRVLTVDVADPSSPRVESDTTYSGSLLSAREYDGTVRLVVSTGAPALDFVHPGRHRTEREATRENREIVRRSTVEDWLPRVGPGGGSRTGAGPLVECTDVRHPEESSGFSTISIVTFEAASPAARDTSAVTASGDLVYSSAERLYVATSTDGWWGQPVPLVDLRAVPRKPEPPTTAVHAFAIDGPRTEYVASGVVPGHVRDRWSFSEYDGHLRVATALGQDSWNPRENAVVVLEERGRQLAEVGRVGGMGVGEQIQSVRWFGDVAVVVTFRQVDPLYTLDLADPGSPRVLGELKIPGFSAYLHPIGGNLLLGLGQDATRRGTSIGAQAATFDIGDLGSPARLDTEAFGEHTDFLTRWDSRAFTYLPEERLALAPVQNTWTGRTRVALLRVGEDGTLRRTATATVGGWYPSSVRTLPLGDGRVVLVADGQVTELDV